MLRKLLRGAGMALIFMPDPFSTPFGLALLGLSYLCRRFSMKNPPYLRHLIRLYLHEAGRTGSPDNVIRHKLKQKLSGSAWRYQPKKEIRCAIDTNRLLLRFAKDKTIANAVPVAPLRHSMKKRWAGYVWPGAPPDIPLRTSAARVIDNSLSARFPDVAGGNPGIKVTKTMPHRRKQKMRSGRGNAPMDTSREGAWEKAVYHSLKPNRYGYVLPSVPVYVETAVVHTVNGGKLMRHYENTMLDRSTATRKPVFHYFNPVKAGLVLSRG